ncbi:MAG: response regulator [Candidatus Aminicenantes bacterium]|nr:response regulator [Candidatus Aminicenantes bacterium]
MTYKVIVADGSPSVRKAAELAFPESDFELFCFDNGQELARALPEIGPDALLVGLSLPGLDGYRAASLLRGLKELDRTAIFFLRGVFENFEADKAAGLDYEDVVRKPFDSEALAGRLKSLLDRRHDVWSFPEASEVAAPPQPARPAESRELAELVSREVDRACAAIEERVRRSVLQEEAGCRRREAAAGKRGGRKTKP